MKVISYFDCNNKEYWAQEIKKSDWAAAPLLITFLDKKTFFENRGEGGKILLLGCRWKRLPCLCTHC